MKLTWFLSSSFFCFWGFLFTFKLLSVVVEEFRPPSSRRLLIGQVVVGCLFVCFFVAWLATGGRPVSDFLIESKVKTNGEKFAFCPLRLLQLFCLLGPLMMMKDDDDDGLCSGDWQRWWSRSSGRPAPHHHLPSIQPRKSRNGTE